MPNHLIDGLEAAQKAAPDTLLATTDDGATMTYGTFFDGARKVAQVLAEAGLTPGDRVAAQTAKSLTALQLYIGTVMAGGVYLPLNTGYQPAELAYFVGDAAPRIFVCDPGSDAQIAGLTDATRFTLDATGAGSLTAARDMVSPLPAHVDRQPGDLAAILYTSGTTGKPKGAMLSHDNLLSNSRTLAKLWRFVPEDVLIHALPVFHTHGLFVATNVTLLSGGAMIFLPGFDAGAILKHMPYATAMMGVPTFYTRLLQQDGLAKAATNMRLFVSGSAPLLAETHSAWQAATGHRILERYGMTETNMNTSNPYDGDRRAGTVGFPLPDVDLRIIGGDGNAVEDDAPGNVQVRGPNVFKGYWNLPEKTAEELLPDGFFITGDIGRVDKDGYLHIIGRAKDLVISGGFNVYPKEVEALIDAVPGVLESAVIGVPHPDFGEGVVAIVVPSGDTSATAIADAIRPDLARFKQPKHIEIVQDLPRNTMGKVQKNILRDTYRDLFTT